MTDLDIGTLVGYIRFDTTQLDSSGAKAVASVKQTGSKMEQAAKQTGNAIGAGIATGADAAAESMKRLGAQAVLANDKAKAATEKYQKAVKDAAAGNAEAARSVQRLGAQSVLATQDAAAAMRRYDQAAAAAAGSVEKTAKSTSGLKDAAKLAAVALGAVGFGKLIKAAADAEQSNIKLQAQLGATGDEAKRFGQVAKDVFANNFAGSVQEANDAIKSVVQNIAGMRTASAADLGAVTDQVSALASTFGVDLNSVTIAVGQQMKTGLAKNATEALDNVTAGFQAGDDKAGDFLDTLNEYSTQFRKLGIDGKTATGLLSQGLQGGARDSDIVGDALKELSIRVSTVSSLTTSGFQSIGLNASDMYTQFGRGGKDAAAATELVLNGLRNLRDPTKQAAAATALFGTQSEDLGKALYSLDLSKAAKQMGDVAGAAQKVADSTGKGVNNSIQGFVNQLKATGLTIGQDVLPMVEPLLGGLGKIAGVAGDATRELTSLPGPIQTTGLAFGAIVLLGPKLLSMLSNAKGRFLDLGGAATGVRGSIASLGKSLAAGGVFAAGLYVVGQFSDSMARAKKVSDELKGSQDQLTTSLVESHGAFGQVQQDLLMASVAGSDSFKKLVADGVPYADLMDLATGKTKDASKALAEFINSHPDFDDVDLLKYVTGLSGIAPGAEAAAKAQNDYSAAQKQSADVEAAADASRTAHLLAFTAAAVSGTGKAGDAFVSFGNSIPVAALNALHDDSSGVTAWGASVSSAALSAKDSMDGANTAIAHLPGTLMGVAKAADLSAAAKSVADFGAKAQTASAETDAFALAVDKLTGRDVPLEEAQKNLNAQILGVSQAFKDATAATKGHTESLIDSTGKVKTETKAGQDLYDSVTSYKNAYDTSVTAAVDAAGAHATVAQKLKAAQGAAQDARQAFIDQAVTVNHLTLPAAEALADHMGILESKKLTPKTLHLDAEDKASGTIDSIEKKLQGIKDKTVKLVVDATGGSMKINSDGSFTTSAGGHGAAAGTTVTGGIPGVDSVPMLLMPGEEVIKTSEANKHRGLLKDINAGRMASGGTVGGDLHIKASGRGNADPAFASVTSYMARAVASAASLNAAAAKAVAAIPHANSGGTEQWRALALLVARAKGESPASVQVMLNQMSRESGGNPAAINLTDINAQLGHPSVGLLQFIPSTFRNNADPGYNTNIYDPQSQMRAWYNYINSTYGGYVSFGARGYGAYAGGGTIPGGIPGRDSVPSLLMPGEEVIKTSAANKHRPLLKAINAGRMASGGTVGLVGAAQLGGAPDPVFGDRTSRIIAALSSIADSINAARGKAVDDASKRHDAQVQYNADHDAQIRADRAYEKSKTAANLQAKKVADAQAALSLKTLSNTRVAAMVSAHNAAAAASQQRALQGQYRALQGAGARYDVVAARVGTARDTLSGTLSSKAQAVAGYASSIAGFDGGITGHSDVRGTAAAVINGQRFDLGRIKAFQGDITKLKREGLSADILSQLTSQFGSGGEITAHALASGSLAQVRAANSLQAQITSAATATGTSVAGSQYDALIKAQSAQVSTLTHQLAIVNNQISYLARTIEGKLVHALSEVKFYQDPQGAWKIVQQGQKLAARRG